MSFKLLTPNARAYTHVDNGRVKRNYLIFDDNLVISGTDIPPCKITETGFDIKQFTKITQDAFSDTDFYPPPGGRSQLEDVLEMKGHNEYFEARKKKDEKREKRIEKEIKRMEQINSNR